MVIEKGSDPTGWAAAEEEGEEKIQLGNFHILVLRISLEQSSLLRVCNEKQQHYNNTLLSTYCDTWNQVKHFTQITSLNNSTFMVNIIIVYIFCRVARIYQVVEEEPVDVILPLKLMELLWSWNSLSSVRQTEQSFYTRKLIIALCMVQ